jgi:hypothetical protein
LGGEAIPNCSEQPISYRSRGLLRSQTTLARNDNWKEICAPVH